MMTDSQDFKSPSSGVNNVIQQHSESTSYGAVRTNTNDDVKDQVDIECQSEEDATVGKPRWFTFLLTKHFWITFFLGQLLSLSIVSTNTMTSFLAEEGLSIPAFQSLFNYALLTLIFLPYTIYRYGFKKWAGIVFRDGWKFFILSFADVEGNYFVVLAYEYTNMLSAALLDNFAIVVVVVLSFLLLKVRYHWLRILAILFTIGGMALLIVSDYLTGKNFSGSHIVKGDIFVLIGACGYGISNVLEEYLVSKRPMYEVLSFMGTFGVCILGVQAAIFDRDSIRDAVWTDNCAGYFVGYTLSLLFLYLTAPILFRMSSAAFYNLSLLTSDFWSLCIGIRVFGYYVYWLYPVGFVCTVLGIIVYNIVPQTLVGEAIKPWLRKDQADGIDGIGTAKRALKREQRAEDVEDVTRTDF